MVPMLTIMAVFIASALTLAMAAAIHDANIQHRFAQARLDADGGFSR
jgi:hypothetical protein